MTPTPGANALVNGGYETGLVAPWQVDAGTVFAVAAPWKRSGAFGGQMNGNGRVSQLFPTAPGATYTVTIYARIDAITVAGSYGGPSFSVYNQWWNLKAFGPVLSGTVASIGVWQPATFTFVADTAQSRLTVDTSSDRVFDFSVDDAVVTGP